MTKFNTLTASILFAALSLTACGDDNDTVAQPNKPDTNTQQQRISGMIKDASGSPVVGAKVKIGKSAVTTDSAGNYSLSLDKSESDAVILVRKTGYLTMAREFKVAPKRSHKLDITLTVDQVTNAFATSAGISELQVSGAKISIPANSIVKADGSSYTGTVNIAANYYNPDSIAGAQSFAQPFAGQNNDGSQQTDLVTVGVIDVKLTDPATGAALNLKKGTQATLVYPKVSTDQNLPSIPLWYYDEEQTVWVKEGVATRQTDGSYKGQVSHFTLWNLDIPIGEYYALLKGCVIDANTKKPYVKDDFAGQITGRGSFFSAGGADSEGKFSIKVPFNTPLTLSSYPYSVTFNTIQIPALAQNGTYQINNGNCIEVGTIDSDGEIDLNNSDVGGIFDELPLAPEIVTPNPIPPAPPAFEPPSEENTIGLIGYSFDFETDSDTDSGLENILFNIMSSKSNNILETIEKSLYEDQDYGSFAGSDYFLLTPQGINTGFKTSITNDKKLKIEQLNTTFSSNQYTQRLNNGYVSTGTYKDVSLSGQKIGTVFALINNEDYYNDIPQTVIDKLNNLPNTLSTFNSNASCKKALTGSVNMDSIQLLYKLPNLSFDSAIAGFNNTDFKRGTWAGIPWIAGKKEGKDDSDDSDDSDDDDLIAFVSYNNEVYASSYEAASSQLVKEEEKDDCEFYNESAKNQILAALRTAYPTL